MQSCMKTYQKATQRAQEGNVERRPLMKQNLKTQLIRTVLQFKRMSNAGFGIDTSENKSDVNMTELLLMYGIADNTLDSKYNVGMTEIREYLSVSKAAVSQMLSSLEKKGYINRDIDKNNRRSLIVTLTSAGQKVLSNEYNVFNKRLDRIIDELGREDVEQMIAIVGRMTEIMKRLDEEQDQKQVN